MAVAIGKVTCGKGQTLTWIAGPCVIESHELTLMIAERLAEMASKMEIPLIFKASYDKANRTSIKSFRGPGLHEGLKTLDAVVSQVGPTATISPTLDAFHAAFDPEDLLS